MDESPQLTTFIYLDDVRLTEGTIEIRTAQGVDLLIDGTLDPDDLHSLIARSTCIVNGLPATPVGPVVIDQDRRTLIWRFETTS